MSIRDFDAAPGILGRNIRDAFLSSASSAVASIEEPPAPVPKLTLPTAISPHIRLIRRGKGPRRKFGLHPKARGCPPSAPLRLAARADRIARPTTQSGWSAR